MRQANHYYLFGVVLSERAWHRVTNQSGQVSYVNGEGGYRYNGINGQELDTELGAGVSTAEYWEYDAKLGRRWNLDKEKKFQESPYASFANNPIWFIDKDGNDTLVVHRSGVYKSIEGSRTDLKAYIYVVTFSIIENGVETKLQGTMLMMSNQNFLQLKKNSIFKLKPKQMGNMSMFSSKAKTIRVFGQNMTNGQEAAIFIHPGNDASNVNGCLTMCEEEDFNVDNEGDAIFKNTTDAILKVISLYKQYEKNLTGDKFILQTDSRAEDTNEDIQSIKVDKLTNGTLLAEEPK